MQLTPELEHRPAPAEAGPARSGRHRAKSPYVGGGKNDKYRFTVIADGLLRFEWAPDSQFEDRPSSFAYQRDRTSTDFDLRETADNIEITTSRFQLTYDRQEFSTHGLYALVFGFSRSLWRYNEQGQSGNQGGTTRTLDGVDGRIDLGHGIMSDKGYAVLDDTNSFVFDDDGWVAGRRPGGGRLDCYLFAYGHDYRDAIKAFYRISGSTPLLPRWALGNWWSRYHAYSDREYLGLMDSFRSNGIPLSVAVLDMDWHLVDDQRVRDAGQTGWTGYTWNRDLFPDPEAFLEELHNRNLKVTLNDHPADGIHSYEDIYAKAAKALGIDPKSEEPIEFNITDKKFAKVYYEVVLRSLEEQGVDFWWIDWQQGLWTLLKNVDPLWMLNHYGFIHNAKTPAHKKHHPKAGWPHPLVFSRYGGPGSHRYPIGFSGDSVVSWGSLNFQPEMTATAANIGYGWWSHDIGGHFGGIKDDDLMVRWVQLGVLSPIMRLHSTNTRWVVKEPWKLPRVPADIVTDWLKLRHRLIPYLHTMNARAADGEHGLPLVQPMYWEWGGRGEAYGWRNQYLFGTELFVVPITSPTDSRVKMARVNAWMPPGTWVDIFTGVVYTGDRSLWLSRSTEDYPVFLKEGGILPLDAAAEPENGGPNPAGFEVLVAVGRDGYFEILEEDDQSQSEGEVTTAETKWRKIPIRFTQSTGKIEIGPVSGPGAERAGTREWSVRVVGVSVPSNGSSSGSSSISVHVGGQPVAASTAGFQAERVRSGTLVRVGRVPFDKAAVVELGADPRAHRNDVAALAEPLLRDAQIDYGWKDAVWGAVENPGVPVAIKLAQLQMVDASEELKSAIREFVVADLRHESL